MRINMMRDDWWILFHAILVIGICYITKSDASIVDDYLKELDEKKYDPNQPPDEFLVDGGAVTIWMYPGTIQDLDEFNGHLDWMTVTITSWEDPRTPSTKLSPGRFGYVIVPRERLWSPKLDIFNKAKKSDLLLGHNKAVVTPYGHVIAFVKRVSHTVCIPDLRLFPNDRQECDLILGVWAYAREHLSIYSMDPDHESSYLPELQTRNARWEVINIKTIRETPERIEQLMNTSESVFRDSRSSVTYRVSLQRRNPLVSMAFYTSLFAGAMASLTSLCIKAGVRARMFTSLGSFLVTMYSVISIKHLVPVNNKGMPLLAMYCTSFMLLSCIIVLHVIISDILKRLKKPVPECITFVFRRMPQCVAQILQFPVGGCAGISNPSGKQGIFGESEDQPRMSGIMQMIRDQTEDGNTGSKEWPKLAQILDGIAFWIYLFAMLGCWIAMTVQLDGSSVGNKEC